jgi:hypothetical protein
VTGSLSTSGSFTTTGTITATTLVVQTITSSISSITGSTNFGSLAANTHTFTGSMSVSGSGTFTGALSGTSATFSGNVGIGNNVADTINSSSGLGNLVVGNGGGSSQGITIYTNSSTYGGLNFADATSGGGAYAGYIKFDHTNDSMGFFIGNTQRLSIASTGAATFSSTAQNAFLINSTNTDGPILQIQNSGNNLGLIGNAEGITNGGATNFAIRATNNLIFSTGGANPRMTITSGGNVGIGTSVAANARFNVFMNDTDPTFGSKIQAVFGPSTYLDSDATNIFGGGTSETQFTVGNTARPAMISLGGNINTGEGIGVINFFRSSNTDGYRSRVQIWTGLNTTGTSNQHGGFLAISTATDNATNPQERMRIDSAGIVMIGTTNTNPAENNVKGVAWYQDGRQFISSDNNEVMRINRKTSDGVLVFFHQDGTAEGNISVSGTTVSYNGGHLSRYSQTETYQRIEGLLKGTVMSNLDKMAEWIDPKTGEPYANEQLNCMKISDVEGDVNVAGVFVNWDDDDKSFTSDMNIAMTGDMIIRIAQNVVVEKGQLLMSAGDGTAKPQEDDIVRSKTIAKVTSNHITCVYEDGSYCVPCVLMAC